MMFKVLVSLLEGTVVILIDEKEMAVVRHQVNGDDWQEVVINGQAYDTHLYHHKGWRMALYTRDENGKMTGMIEPEMKFVKQVVQQAA